MRVRLSPKSVFLGIIAFGLPIALTTGWALGVPSAPQRPVVPAGAGVIGPAPSVVTSVPVSTVPVPRSSSGARTMRVRTGATVVVAPTSAPTPSTTGATESATVRPPRPTRTHEPSPVPTRTDAAGTSPPTPTAPPPTADPSASPGSRVRP
jgi:hypothetical protein